jgi:hypothetical protein
MLVPTFGQRKLTSITYELLQFPIHPRKILDEAPGGRNPEEAELYLSWLQDIDVDRTIYAMEVFDSAGFSYEISTDPFVAIGEFEEWLRAWSNLLLRRYVGEHWRIGQFGLEFPRPGSGSYNLEAETLFCTIAHDASFVVLDYARRTRPLPWILSDERFPRPLIGLDPRRLKVGVRVGASTVYPTQVCTTVVLDAISSDDSPGDAGLLQELYLDLTRSD